jgi:hypothetical protein
MVKVHVPLFFFNFNSLSKNEHDGGSTQDYSYEMIWLHGSSILFLVFFIVLQFH